MRTLKLLWNLTIPSLVRQPAPGLGLRRDPAPSLWSYRYQRLMLTPFYRRLVRLGLPAALVVLVALLWLSSAANRATVAGWSRRTTADSLPTDRKAFAAHLATGVLGSAPNLTISATRRIS